MSRRPFISLTILAFLQLSLSTALSPPSLAQEWAFGRPRGTLRVADLFSPSTSIVLNYAEGLVTLDKDNNWVPCLAVDWRWTDERRVEFKLRRGVTFHNGENFNAEAVRVNWEAYRSMESPRVVPSTALVDETLFEVIDPYTVSFIFPEPDALAFSKFQFFFQVAPAFFKDHKFPENNWGFLPEAGPWATGPFEFVEGNLRFARPGDQVILEAYKDYWDRRYPKVQKVVFDNSLTVNREETMRLLRENEGVVDIVSRIRPLDTLKVAESAFGKVVKSKDVAILEGMINQRKRDSKWRDVRLRKALNYAINRKELWKYCAKGNAYNLGGYIPPEAYGHNPDLVPYTYDTTKARLLLAEAGYPEGFEVKIITWEAWKLEAQIISKMLERIALKVKFEILPWPEFLRKVYIPVLDKPPEEQDWDLVIFFWAEWFGHTAATFLNYHLLDESRFRWIEYDPDFERMFKEMARTLDRGAQEEKIRQMVGYVYDRAYALFIYSPLSLYAVNKEVNFVPHKLSFLRLKETSVTDKHWSIRGQK
jgi:peptide/nickel transport system substrate-binding protein